MGQRRTAGHDTAALRAHAGTPEYLYAEARPGDRVRVKEGYTGVVDDVLDGPPHVMTYFVTLDDNQGGGEWGPGEVTVIGSAEAASQVESDIKTAADDYPELGTVLSDRPPLQVTKAAGLGPKVSDLTFPLTGQPRLPSQIEPGSEAEQGYQDGARDAKEKPTREYVSDSGEYRAGYDLGWAEGIDIAVPGPPGEGQLTDDIEQRLYSLRSESQSMMDADPEGYFESQAAQAPPGLHEGMNFHVEMVDGKRIDCVYYVKGGRIDGILYHYDADFPPYERKGNVNLIVRPGEQRKGVGTEMLRFALGRVHIDFDAQDYTEQGRAFVDKFLAEGSVKTADWSYDWCRFRRDNHCFLPKDLNVEASKEAGYSVWVPFDRGRCPRQKWEDQKVCPVGEPGPHATGGGFLDATVPWEQGGQRMGPGGHVVHVESSVDSVGAEGRLLLPLSVVADSKTAAMTCSNCGASTLGYMVTTQGGTRTYDVAVPRSRKVYCKDCAKTRVEELNERDRRRTSARPGRVGDLLSAGEVVLTASGRETTPFPRVDVSNDRRAGNTVGRVRAWLHENAKAEIAARGLIDTIPDDPGQMTTADADIAEMVLFDRDWTASYDVGGPRNLTSELRLQLTASWSDVRAKARRIRTEGGVRILRADRGAVVGQVRGDTNVYETEVHFVPGTSRVGFWTCGCAWAAYSWGRSGPWKKYEGRSCSHSLALQYEAQSRGMFGQTVQPDQRQPEWMDTSIPVKVPGDYDRDKGRHAALGSVESDAHAALGRLHLNFKALKDDVEWVAPEPDVFVAKREGKAWVLLDGKEVRGVKVRGLFGRNEGWDAKWREFTGLLSKTEESGGGVVVPGYVKGDREIEASAMSVVRKHMKKHTAASLTRTALDVWEFFAQVAGRIQKLWVTPDGVTNTTGQTVADPIVYPTWHPTRGLDLRERKAMLHEAGMDPELSAGAIMELARRYEPTITEYVTALAKEHDGTMDSLDFRLKTNRARIVQKIVERMERYGMTASQAALKIDDTVRYTMLFGTGDYTPGVKDVLADFERTGIQIVKRKNYWQRGDNYQGFNSTERFKGHLWELQFHTPQSLEAKMKTHPLYEQYRTLPDHAEAERFALNKQMVAIADAVPVPSGIEAVPVLTKQEFLRAVAFPLHQGYRYLLVEEPDGDPIDLIRHYVSEGSESSHIDRWTPDGWKMDNSYADYVFGGQNHTTEVDEDQASDWIRSHSGGGTTASRGDEWGLSIEASVEQDATDLLEAASAAGEAPTAFRWYDGTPASQRAAEADLAGWQDSLLLPGEPTYDIGPFAFAGPNGTAGVDAAGHWGFYPDYDGEPDEPDPALPVTYSDDDDDDEELAATLTAALAATSEFASAPVGSTGVYNGLRITKGEDGWADSAGNEIPREWLDSGARSGVARLDKPKESALAAKGPLPDHLKPFWGGMTVDPRDNPMFCARQSHKTPAIPWHNGGSKCLSCGRDMTKRAAADEPSGPDSDAPGECGKPGHPAWPHDCGVFERVKKRYDDSDDMDAQGVLRAHEARLRALAEGTEPEGPDPFAHLQSSGQESPDVAAAAREFLAKQGLKDFTPGERAAIIEEGEGGDLAGNFDSLDIAGTHYEALERSMAIQDDSLTDEDWMYR